ncbi:hypothetical protein COCON_G00209580 [Conger conger]|uniref:Uncharacterized protein n=1 Tax=Conger conger TaxID=82655 RepID=A0A9Q1HQN4_CONCO|nr:hypothetical protein COCON_G00209580 [Conger conger]
MVSKINLLLTSCSHFIAHCCASDASINWNFALRQFISYVREECPEREQQFMEDKKRKKEEKIKKEASQKIAEQKSKVPDSPKPTPGQSAAPASSAAPSPGPPPPRPRPPPAPPRRAGTMPGARRCPTDSPPPEPPLPRGTSPGRCPHASAPSRTTKCC